MLRILGRNKNDIRSDERGTVFGEYKPQKTDIRTLVML